MSVKQVIRLTSSNGSPYMIPVDAILDYEDSDIPGWSLLRLRAGSGERILVGGRAREIDEAFSTIARSNVADAPVVLTPAQSSFGFAA